MDKILTFIKKYSTLLIPAAIVLFAFILLIPTMLIGGSLKEKMEKSARQGDQVLRLADNASSKKDVDNERAFQDQLENDAKQVALLAKQTTQRDLISYDIFPEPVDSSVQIFSSFGEKLREEIEGMLKKGNARSAPTDIEIKQELEKRGNIEDQSGMGGGGYYPRIRNRQSKRDAYEITKDAFLKERAKQMSLYATANVFEWYTFWEAPYNFENQETALKHCWYSQLAYWVYEDVVESIKSINGGSSSVFNSGVKRLVGVNFRKTADYLRESRYSGMTGYAGRGGYNNNKDVKGDIPEYILSASRPDFFGVVPLTNRVCDDKIDIIHFNMAVVISADSVFSFIKELCSEKSHTYKGYLKPVEPQTFKHNQITVLQYRQEPVVKTEPDHERYRYGDDAVVKLNLTCEYIFNRSGYDEIKPASVVEKLKPDGAASGNPGLPGMF